LIDEQHTEKRRERTKVGFYNISETKTTHDNMEQFLFP